MNSTSNSTVKTTEQRLSNKRYSVRRLLAMTRPYFKGILIAVVCVIVVNLVVVVKPYLLKLIIDDFFSGRVRQTPLYSITTMGLLYFLVAVLGCTFSFIQVNIINRVGQGIIRTLRSRVFRTIQLLPLGYLDKTPSGRLITRATNDIEALSAFYTNVLLSLFKDVFLLAGIIYAMFAMDVRLSLLSFSIIPFMSAGVFLLRRTIRRNFTRVKALIGRINGFMAENISGMRIVQIFRAEKEKKRQFDDLNDQYSRATILQVQLNSLLRPGAEFLQNVTIALLLWYGMGKVADLTLDVGVIYAFTTYIKQFFGPVADLADQYTTIQSAIVSADRIFELLDQEPQLEDLESGRNMERIKGEIEFKHVWFAYDGENWVLKDVSFKIARGQTVAFVGETGAGKTTIISLINGFYRPQRGEILIDGVNVSDIRLTDLRRNIAVVLQDVFLFSGNIEQNITLYDDIEHEQIEDALSASCADEFIASLKAGIHEPVAENGSTFSAGQKQLLSFARAIAHNPSILVCDEATANIDTHTETLIQKAIENIARDRTTLIIAHRLSTIRNADLIIVMKNGRIAEMGTHDELVKLRRYYKSLLDQNAG